MSNVCDNMVCGEKLECFFVFFQKQQVLPIYVGATHLRRLIDMLHKKRLLISSLPYHRWQAKWNWPNNRRVPALPLL